MNQEQAHVWVGGDNQLPREHCVHGAVKLAASIKVMMDPMPIFVTKIMAEGNVNIITVVENKLNAKKEW